MGIAEAAARTAPRRSDAGKIRYTERDVAGLLLLAEHYAAPYDLLSAALEAPPARTRAIVARWRAAGLVLPVAEDADDGGSVDADVAGI